MSTCPDCGTALRGQPAGCPSEWHNPDQSHFRRGPLLARDELTVARGGIQYQTEPWPIRTVAHRMTVHRDVLMDEGVIPDTRPRGILPLPPETPRQRLARLRRTALRRIQPARTALALRIAPWLEPDDWD